MEDRTGTVTCERSDDLVSFLYQELDEREGRDFEHHLERCSACARELALFSEVRNGVVAWREQSLGIVSSNQPASVALSHSTTPSALAAMRQFFALSPVWLKGAVALGSVLLFAVIAFLLVSLNTKPAAPVAGIDKVYTEAELRAKVEEEIQARVKELNQQQNVVKEDLVRVPVLVQSKPKPKSFVYTAKIRRAPLTKSERQQLAADLRLISPTEEDLNLLGEQINR